MAVLLSLHCVWEYEDQLEILGCILTGMGKNKAWVWSIAARPVQWLS